MARVLSFLIRYISNYYTLHRSDLAARAAPLDPRLRQGYDFTEDTTSTWLQNFHIFVYISKFYSLKVKIKGLQMITKNDNV